MAMFERWQISSMRLCVQTSEMGCLRVFMASVKLPWTRVWEVLWRAIPDPLTDGRLLLALDDSINPKTGKKVFGCQSTFDHAAKDNQSRYVWAQTLVTVGLLKVIHGRWSCVPGRSTVRLHRP